MDLPFSIVFVRSVFFVFAIIMYANFILLFCRYSYKKRAERKKLKTGDFKTCVSESDLQPGLSSPKRERGVIFRNIIEIGILFLSTAGGITGTFLIICVVTMMICTGEMTKETEQERRARNIRLAIEHAKSAEEFVRTLPHNKNNPENIFKQGKRYLIGDGVPEDKTQGVKLIRQAAEQGLADAQAMLGNCYLEGIGVPTDKAEAIQWYRKAAEQENEDAKEALKHLDN